MKGVSKKYYWLKLKEDFFEQDAIDWLEEQEKGKEYCLFYLKLCLKSLRTNGILIRTVGQLLVPYDAKKTSRNHEYRFRHCCGRSETYMHIKALLGLM